MASESATIPAGYKQTEIGVFPEDWDIKTLGEIGEVTGAGVDKKSNPDEQSVRLVNYVDVYNRRPITSNLLSHWVTAPENKANRCSVRKGDVFFTPTSEVREDIAVSSMALEDIPDAVYSYHLVRLRCNDEVEVAYRAHAFTAKYFLDQASVLADGSGTRYVVNLPNFRRMLVALPPRDEQRRIGTLLTDVETQIAKLSEFIDKKINIKQGAMQELLTGKTRLPGFTGDWITIQLKDFLKTPVTDGPHLTPIFHRTGIPFLSVNNLVDNRIDFSELRYISEEDHIQFSKKCKPERNDILLGKAASVGKVAIVDFDLELNIWSPLALIRVNEKHDPKFVFYSFQSHYVLKQIELFTNTSSQGNIGMGDIELLIFSLPDKNEQVAIAKVLSDMDAEIAALEQRLEKTKTIKQGMMQQLFTGRVRLVEPVTPTEVSA